MLQIRVAGVEDGPAVGELSELAYRADGYLDDDIGNLAAVLGDGARRIRESTVLVAERDGAAVGTVTLTEPGEPWAEVAGPGELEVRMLAVSPGTRRQGIAEALMSAAVTHARSRRLERVVLCTGVRMHGAQQLYEHLGFERLPDRDWSPVPGIELLAYGRGVDHALSSEDN